MRNFVLPILVLFCLVLGFIYILTNTPFVLNMMVPDIINRHAQGIRIEYFQCRSLKSQLPDILMMRDVQMRVVKGERVFDIGAKQITVHNFFDFVKKQEVIYLSGDGVSLKTEQLSAVDAKFKLVAGLSRWDVTFGEGALFSKVLHLGPYTFQKIVANLKGNKKGVEIADIKGMFFGATVKGKVTFDFHPRFGYVVWSEFTGLQSQLVTSPYPEFFSSINGDLKGSVRVVGSDQIDIFTVILEAQKGTTIAPEIFLKMKGAFDTEEEAELKRLSEAQAFLKAERALLHMQNSRNQSIMFMFDIEESDNQILLKGRFPLAWDKGFDTFLFPSLTP